VISTASSSRRRVSHEPSPLAVDGALGRLVRRVPLPDADGVDGLAVQAARQRDVLVASRLHPALAADEHLHVVGADEPRLAMIGLQNAEPETIDLSGYPVEPGEVGIGIRTVYRYRPKDAHVFVHEVEAWEDEYVPHRGDPLGPLGTIASYQPIHVLLEKVAWQNATRARPLQEAMAARKA